MSQTSLSEIGLPGMGEGILHPMVINKFRVLFRAPDLELLPFGKALTHQAIRTSEFGVTRGLSLTFEEDVTGQFGRALQELAQVPHFVVDIEYLDGNERVVKTARFAGCSIASTLYSALDYAGAPSSVNEELRLNVPSWEGKKFEALAKEHPTAATLIALLKGASLSVVRERSEQRGVAEVKLQLNYGELKVTWA